MFAILLELLCAFRTTEYFAAISSKSSRQLLHRMAIEDAEYRVESRSMCVRSKPNRNRPSRHANCRKSHTQQVLGGAGGPEDSWAGNLHEK